MKKNSQRGQANLLFPVGEICSSPVGPRGTQSLSFRGASIVSCKSLKRSERQVLDLCLLFR